MGVTAMLETDQGEFIDIMLNENAYAGRALNSFIVPISVFFSGDSDHDSEDQITQWIYSMNITMDILNQCTHRLFHSCYPYLWDYGKNDYSRYIEENPHENISEDEFIHMIDMLDSTWTDALLLYHDVGMLINLFKVKKPVNTWWYEEESTIDELNALYNAIGFAIKSQVKNVRLVFD
ncbi:hypothetical protein F8S13_02970 [Chloroflexia bacterium SDU3-3]|nr:hypothetical protein F8S13_02970 [Chloroflexia bacterium SDU3-3]